ncbi:hypothetical protein G3I60_19220 [Streptomyces sp. SID13666]|uniref:hypothetical protein n=1 Tax=unclassified Streptomyces TaxID=2593676 RepID=UPI0013C073C0|nr:MULTISPECIES: hypothetical protein [unclassified Streptomyces]NEA56223.1 hypothetical protein [Streptomyces sp. SID13666]NEA71894.1 hypothetical protein [Streptomyces sp. SID13588]
MKMKILSVALLASMALGIAPAAHAVDVNQEYNVSHCYFDKSKSGAERAKYCKALEGKPMSALTKNCLLKAGVGSAAALIVGRVNKKAAREIVNNTVTAGAAACLSSFIK